MASIIIENVRGQWVVDKTTTGAFQEDVGYGDGALIKMDISNPESLCHHPDSSAVCDHCSK